MDNYQHSILIVEDSPDDFFAAQRGLKRAGLANALVHVETGEAAIDYLMSAEVQDNPPDLVLLDLNLPGINGVEVLEQIRASNALRTLPVIVLTTSDNPRDIQAAYRAGANSYVRKPVDLEGFMTALARLKDFWFDVVLLPGPRNTR